MSQKDEELREAPENWRAYLKESLEIFRVFGWVIRTLISPEARRQAKIGVAYRMGAMLVVALAPLLLAAAIDKTVAGERESALVCIALYVGIRTASRWFQNRAGKRTERVWGLSMVDIESRTTALFLSKSLGQHLEEDSKLTAANIEKGLGQSLNGVMTILNFAVPAFAELVVGFLFLFFFSPVAGACLVVALAGYLVFHVWMNRRIIEVCTPIDEEWRAANRFRYERLENPERVKTSGKEEDDTLKLHKMLSRTALKDFDFWGVEFLNAAFIRGTFGDIMTGLAIGYGFYLAGGGVWQVGTAVALVTWANMVRDNLYQIGNIELQLNKSVYRIAPMMEALEMPPDVVDKPDAVELEDEPVTISVKGLRFAYPAKKGEPQEVLKGIDFTIEPGEQVALIGESGAGKTSVMRLLMRSTDAYEGEIAVNGIPLTDIKLRSWRRILAYVPQQSQVFDGTIGMNIRYAMSRLRNEEVSDEELTSLMDELRLRGERFKDGVGTVVGRKGAKLSGGQAQRVMVLSAIARKPRFLIIDEATSSLDSTTEREVQAAIERAIESSSSALIIAHRLSTVRRCTKFIVLRPASEVAAGMSQIEAIADSVEHAYTVSKTFRRLADDQGFDCGVKLHDPKALPPAQNHWYNV